MPFIGVNITRFPRLVRNKSQKRVFVELISNETSENFESFEDQYWHTGCPVKNDDFGEVSPPLRASCFMLRNLFHVTENTACRGQNI